MKNHTRAYTPCQCGVMNDIPLTCGKAYVSPTECCLNDRSREHANALKAGAGRNLAIHRRDYSSLPNFKKRSNKSLQRAARARNTQVVPNTPNRTQLRKHGGMNSLNKEIVHLDTLDSFALCARDWLHCSLRLPCHM